MKNGEDNHEHYKTKRYAARCDTGCDCDRLCFNTAVMACYGGRKLNNPNFQFRRNENGIRYHKRWR